jgi:hypothetical protein
MQLLDILLYRALVIRCQCLWTKTLQDFRDQVAHFLMAFQPGFDIMLPVDPEQALCRWETGSACERRYRVGEHWYNLRPDALVEYSVGKSRIRFWLEWDRGTMNVRDLAVRFSSYEHYLASREWARERTAPPKLLVVAPEVGKERRIQHVAQVMLAHVSGLVIWTTTAVLLREHGPLAPIWSPVLPLPHQAVQPAGSPRRCVFEAIPQEKAR